MLSKLKPIVVASMLLFAVEPFAAVSKSMRAHKDSAAAQGNKQATVTVNEQNNPTAQKSEQQHSPIASDNPVNPSQADSNQTEPDQAAVGQKNKVVLTAEQKANAEKAAQLLQLQQKMIENLQSIKGEVNQAAFDKAIQKGVSDYLKKNPNNQLDIKTVVPTILKRWSTASDKKQYQDQATTKEAESLPTGDAVTDIKIPDGGLHYQSPTLIYPELNKAFPIESMKDISFLNEIANNIDLQNLNNPLYLKIKSFQEDFSEKKAYDIIKSYMDEKYQQENGFSGGVPLYYEYLATAYKNKDLANPQAVASALLMTELLSSEAGDPKKVMGLFLNSVTGNDKAKMGMFFQYANDFALNKDNPAYEKFLKRNSLLVNQSLQAAEGVSDRFADSLDAKKAEAYRRLGLDVDARASEKARLDKNSSVGDLSVSIFNYIERSGDMVAFSNKNLKDAYLKWFVDPTKQSEADLKSSFLSSKLGKGFDKKVSIEQVLMELAANADQSTQDALLEFAQENASKLKDEFKSGSKAFEYLAQKSPESLASSSEKDYRVAKEGLSAIDHSAAGNELFAKLNAKDIDTSITDESIKKLEQQAEPQRKAYDAILAKKGLSEKEINIILSGADDNIKNLFLKKDDAIGQEDNKVIIDNYNKLINNGLYQQYLQASKNSNGYLIEKDLKNFPNLKKFAFTNMESRGTINNSISRSMGRVISGNDFLVELKKSLNMQNSISIQSLNAYAALNYYYSPEVQKAKSAYDDAIKAAHEAMRKKRITDYAKNPTAEEAKKSYAYQFTSLAVGKDNIEKANSMLENNEVDPRVLGNAYLFFQALVSDDTVERNTALQLIKDNPSVAGTYKDVLKKIGMEDRKTTLASAKTYQQIIGENKALFKNAREAEEARLETVEQGVNDLVNAAEYYAYHVDPGIKSNLADYIRNFEHGSAKDREALVRYINTNMLGGELNVKQIDSFADNTKRTTALLALGLVRELQSGKITNEQDRQAIQNYLKRYFSSDKPYESFKQAIKLGAINQDDINYISENFKDFQQKLKEEMGNRKKFDSYNQNYTVAGVDSYRSLPPLPSESLLVSSSANAVDEDVLNEISKGYDDKFKQNLNTLMMADADKDIRIEKSKAISEDLIKNIASGITNNETAKKLILQRFKQTLDNNKVNPQTLANSLLFYQMISSDNPQLQAQAKRFMNDNIGMVGVYTDIYTQDLGFSQAAVLASISNGVMGGSFSRFIKSLEQPYKNGTYMDAIPKAREGMLAQNKDGTRSFLAFYANNGDSKFQAAARNLLNDYSQANAKALAQQMIKEFALNAEQKQALLKGDPKSVVSALLTYSVIHKDQGGIAAINHMLDSGKSVTRKQGEKNKNLVDMLARAEDLGLIKRGDAFWTYLNEAQKSYAKKVDLKVNPKSAHEKSIEFRRAMEAALKGMFTDPKSFVSAMTALVATPFTGGTSLIAYGSMLPENMLTSVASAGLNAFAQTYIPDQVGQHAFTGILGSMPFFAQSVDQGTFTSAIAGLSYGFATDPENTAMGLGFQAIGAMAGAAFDGSVGKFANMAGLAGKSALADSAGVLDNFSAVSKSTDKAMPVVARKSLLKNEGVKLIGDELTKKQTQRINKLVNSPSTPKTKVTNDSVNFALDNLIAENKMGIKVLSAENADVLVNSLGSTVLGRRKLRSIAADLFNNHKGNGDFALTFSDKVLQQYQKLYAETKNPVQRLAIKKSFKQMFDLHNVFKKDFNDILINHGYHESQANHLTHMVSKGHLSAENIENYRYEIKNINAFRKALKEQGYHATEVNRIINLIDNDKLDPYSVLSQYYGNIEYQIKDQTISLANENLKKVNVNHNRIKKVGFDEEVKVREIQNLVELSPNDMVLKTSDYLKEYNQPLRLDGISPDLKRVRSLPKAEPQNEIFTLSKFTNAIMSKIIPNNFLRHGRWFDLLHAPRTPRIKREKSVYQTDPPPLDDD